MSELTSAIESLAAATDASRKAYADRFNELQDRVELVEAAADRPRATASVSPAPKDTWLDRKSGLVVPVLDYKDRIRVRTPPESPWAGGCAASSSGTRTTTGANSPTK